MGIPSSAALCTVTVSSDVLTNNNDVVLAIVLKLASAHQLIVKEDKKKKNVLELACCCCGGGAAGGGGDTPFILKQRNSILRAICGAGLHGALDHAPYYLLGGSFHAGTSPYGSSHVAALTLGALHSWMSVASHLSSSKDDDEDENDMTELLSSLQNHLTKAAFLVQTAATASLADLDLAVALTRSKVNVEDYSAIVRWKRTCLTALQDYATQTGVVLPEHLKVAATVASKAPIFFYGTEDANALLSALYKTTNDITTTTTAAGGKAGKGGKGGEGAANNAEAAQGGNKNNKKQQQQQQSKPKKQQQQPAGAAAAAAAKAKPGSDGVTPAEYTVSALDIRVGKIIKAWPHPDSDKLWCEEVDLGSGDGAGGGGGIRQIASGLREFYKDKSDLENRLVLVLTNLKARSLGGFPSHGMVLCASNADHTAVEFVVPPEGTAVGERVVFEGYEEGTPEPENKVAKKKIFEKVAPDLKTNDKGQVVWKNGLAKTSAGIVQALNGMANASVS